jgi:hypothetical protein
MITITPEFMLNCVFACILAMAVLAVDFLRRRKLTTWEYLLWGLLVLMLPVLGPYLAISTRPGEFRR